MQVPEWFRVGHTTHTDVRSGCTAIMFDRMVPAAVDVRGGAPGTRETTILDPGSVGMLDAILLSGGSAFGLQAAEGLMRYLADHERGVETQAGRVPLVSAAIIFDLSSGSPYHPTADDAYAAAEGARRVNDESGPIGAGTGATVAKIGGSSTPAGLGVATVKLPDFSVCAVVVLNAVGDVRNPETGEWLARGQSGPSRDVALQGFSRARPMENTTIGAVLISDELDRRTLLRCCVSAQAALARCTVPAHTMLDGDTFFAASSGSGTPTVERSLAVTSAAEVAVEQAIVSIFQTA